MRIDQNFLKFDESAHSYTDDYGNAYTSVSKLLGKIKEPFKRDIIANAVAKKRGISKGKVFAEWDEKKNSAIARGNVIHNALERYDKDGVIEDPSLENAILSINSHLSTYKETYSELKLYSQDHLIAGTADKPCYRGNNIMDISDYKTNESKGIEYESKYNKYLLDPLNHLEECNFNVYALQLGCYAYMIEKTWGYKIGKLSIIFIPPSNPAHWQLIPVPYMRSEVKILFDWHKETNNINPVMSNQDFSAW